MSIQETLEQLGNQLVDSPGLESRLIETLVVIVIIWLIRFVAVRLINRNMKSDRGRYRWRKNLTYISVLVGLLVVGRIWFEALDSLATFLGLLSAGLAIALREPVSDLAAWLFIIWRKPFKIGDRIQVGDVKGDVIDIRIFKFTVLEIGNWVHADQSTGRVIHVPNHQIFSKPLANYTSDFEFIWNELQVLVTFESNWKKAKEILQNIADKHLHDYVEEAQEEVRRAAKSYFINYKYLTPIVYTDVKESGIQLTIRHLTNPRKRRRVTELIWEDTLDSFEKEPDIELAYPTLRIYRPES